MFPFRQHICQFCIAKFKQLIFFVLFVLICQSVIIHEPRASGKLIHFPDLFAIWHNFELKSFAYFRSGIIMHLFCICALYPTLKGRTLCHKLINLVLGVGFEPTVYRFRFVYISILPRLYHHHMINHLGVGR